MAPSIDVVRTMVVEVYCLYTWTYDSKGMNNEVQRRAPLCFVLCHPDRRARSNRSQRHDNQVPRLVGLLETRRSGQLLHRVDTAMFGLCVWDGWDRMAGLAGGGFTRQRTGHGTATDSGSG